MAALKNINLKNKETTDVNSYNWVIINIFVIKPIRQYHHKSLLMSCNIQYVALKSRVIHGI
jgi:hypothetical protein